MQHSSKRNVLRVGESASTNGTPVLEYAACCICLVILFFAVAVAVVVVVSRAVLLNSSTRVHVSPRFSAEGTNNQNRKYWVNTPADGPQIIAVDSPLSTLDARINNRVKRRVLEQSNDVSGNHQARGMSLVHSAVLVLQCS